MAVFDPALQTRAAVLREFLLQEVIQPFPGVLL
jgi:hypothetical protein